MISQKYGTSREILMNFAEALTVSATVNAPAATVNDYNRKILKAGTPVGADKPFYLDANNVTLVPITDATASNGQAVIMHDVDITDGPAPVTVIRRGDVVLGNMDDDVQKLYTDAVKNALTHITLV
ncbi:hypothetical protein [Lactiplantibacillus paraxiangfangensis]|uniref:hypothetical protein n=1 Tax=Lactiplantibacillus paraxiangfangensis TaxID=3076224 RepID=UPI0030C70ACF